MRFLFLLLFLINFLLVGCLSRTSEMISECRGEYNAIILADLHRGKYLTSVTATYKGENFRIVLDSFELFELVKPSGQGTDSTTVYSILNGAIPLRLTIDNIGGVSVLRKWKEMDQVLDKGKQYTLDYFFNGHIQKIALSNSERNQLIDALVNWCILVYIDDESGKVKILDLPEYRRIPYKP